MRTALWGILYFETGGNDYISLYGTELCLFMVWVAWALELSWYEQCRRQDGPPDPHPTSPPYRPPWTPILVEANDLRIVPHHFEAVMELEEGWTQCPCTASITPCMYNPYYMLDCIYYILYFIKHNIYIYVCIIRGTKASQPRRELAKLGAGTSCTIDSNEGSCTYLLNRKPALRLRRRSPQRSPVLHGPKYLPPLILRYV